MTYCCGVSISVTRAELGLLFMKCKITRHKESVDKDGAVVATLVTPIGIIRGAVTSRCAMFSGDGWVEDGSSSMYLQCLVGQRLVPPP
jgi:predicted alpha-1,6-mannanase (GH76 family)